MINFVLWLIVIAALGFVFLTVQSALKKRTVPAPSEFTRQVIGESVTESIEQARLTVPVANSHWYRHTFERPRRKVKR